MSEAKLESARAYKRTHRAEIKEWQSKYNRARRVDPAKREKLLEQVRRSNKKAYDERKSYAIKPATEKTRAQRLIRGLIYRGNLIRGSCCICNEPNADAHHEDYDKPREIFWLCRLHHKRRHLNELELNPKDMVYVKPLRFY